MIHGSRNCGHGLVVSEASLIVGSLADNSTRCERDSS